MTDVVPDAVAPSPEVAQDAPSGVSAAPVAASEPAPPRLLPADPDPPKAKIGRPAGAKDAKPRKTPVRQSRPKVTIEPIEQPEVPECKHLPPAPPPTPVATAELPGVLSFPSPRQMLRDAQALIMQAQGNRHEQRRNHFQSNVLRCTSQFNF